MNKLFKYIVERENKFLDKQLHTLGIPYSKFGKIKFIPISDLSDIQKKQFKSLKFTIPYRILKTLLTEDYWEKLYDNYIKN